MKNVIFKNSKKIKCADDIVPRNAINAKKQCYVTSKSLTVFSKNEKNNGLESVVWHCYNNYNTDIDRVINAIPHRGHGLGGGKEKMCIIHLIKKQMIGVCRKL